MIDKSWFIVKNEKICILTETHLDEYGKFHFLNSDHRGDAILPEKFVPPLGFGQQIKSNTLQYCVATFRFPELSQKDESNRNELGHEICMNKCFSIRGMPSGVIGDV